jgi:hypothetical protein
MGEQTGMACGVDEIKVALRELGLSDNISLE